MMDQAFFGLVRGAERNRRATCVPGQGARPRGTREQVAAPGFAAV